jgi:hypothetical protein
MGVMRRRPLLRSTAVGGRAYLLGRRRQEADQRARLNRLRLDDLARLNDDDALSDDELRARKPRL